MFKLLSNTVEGVTQATIGVARLVAAPVTNLIDLEQDHFSDASDVISEGLDKVGKDE